MLPGESAEYRLLAPNFVYAPVERGMALGTLQILVAGKPAAEIPVECGETVELVPETPGFLGRLFGKQAG